MKVTAFTVHTAPQLPPILPADRYKPLVDGEGISLRSSQVFMFACCDCGLVHDIALVARRGGHIGMAVKRNKRATAERRKK